MKYILISLLYISNLQLDAAFMKTAQATLMSKYSSSISSARYYRKNDMINTEDMNFGLSKTNYGAMTERIENDSKDSSTGLLPPWLPSFGTAALGGLLFGSDIGCSSSVVRIFGSGSADLGSVDAVQLGLIASTSLIGAMTASASLIFLGDKQIGRKLELQIASILFLLGTTLQSTAGSLDLLYIGRALYGLGIGVAMHVAPLFIAETSPDNLRGRLVSYKEAAIVGGIVIGYIAGAIFGSGDNWRAVFQSVYPLEVLMIIGSLIVPESSRWLVLRGRKEEAVTALQTAQGLSKDEAKKQIEIMTSLSMNQKVTATSISDKNSDSIVAKEEEENVLSKINEIFGSPYNKRALFIGVGLVLFQQLSGQPSVLYFANRIFETAGLGYEAAVGVGIFKLLMTVVSANLVENPKYGRKTLLLYGNAGITVSLITLASLYAFAPVGALTQAAIIGAILIFVGCYQIGFGPITWLVLSEIFPLRVRSAALSCGTLANFASNLLVTGLFEVERQNLGEGLLFGQFAIIAALATWFTSVYVFETQGLSLEEIEKKLKTIVDA